MKLKTISVEHKAAKNYRSYGVTLTAELGTFEDENACVKELQARARKYVAEQQNIDGGIGSV
ncbi:MAG: hypothetical protein WC444_06655 [Candidatus Paceibacterota bacterium]